MESGYSARPSLSFPVCKRQAHLPTGRLCASPAPAQGTCCAVGDHGSQNPLCPGCGAWGKSLSTPGCSSLRCGRGLSRRLHGHGAVRPRAADRHGPQACLPHAPKGESDRNTTDPHQARPPQSTAGAVGPARASALAQGTSQLMGSSFHCKLSLHTSQPALPVAGS